MLKTEELLAQVSTSDEVAAIGQCGDLREALVPGQSDVDIFVLCRDIPRADVRGSLYAPCSALFERLDLSVCEGGDWGTGDVLVIDGVDVMLMYFRADEMMRYIAEVLAGKHLDSVAGFYPIGRCATMRDIHVQYDRDGVLAALKRRLEVYPEDLSRQMVGYHLHRALDAEDFGRAMRRGDVLFYHQVLEHALDHFLQALFALNKAYFPSRKRTRQYIEGFERKPERCYDRMLAVIALGCDPDHVAESCCAWYALVDDLEGLCGAD